MRSIGIRELRQQASRFLRLVRAGQSIRVTDRGRAIALLVPIPLVEGIEALIAAGHAEPAVGDVLQLGAPLRPIKGVPLPSQSLRRARAHER